MAGKFTGTAKDGIELLSDSGGKSAKAYIGRKRQVHSQYGEEGALLLGKSVEEANYGQKIYLDALSPHVVFITGARGTGKCLTGDCEVQISDGRCMKIKDLKNNGSRVFGLNNELKLEESEKIGFYERVVDKTLKITLRSGREIELTPEHPLLTVNGWVPANLLKEKSRIATPRKINLFGKTKIEDHEVKILAYLIAEGHLGNTFVLFSNYDDLIVNEFKESVTSFDRNLKVSIHSKEGCYRVTSVKKPIDISNVKRNKKGQFTNEGFIIPQKTTLMKWLIKLGLYGKLSKQKKLPDEIMTLNKNQLSLFLNRLFSCDGGIFKRKNHWQIDYSTSSIELAKQIQNLLLRFEIISRLRHKKVKCNGKYFDSYELVVDSENVVRFINEIGFFGSKKIKQEKAKKELRKIKFNPNVDTIPKEIWKIYKINNWAKVGRLIGYSSPKSLSHSKIYSPNREKLLKIAKADNNKHLMKLANSDIFWDEVVSIKENKDKKKVYDISVSQNHNFVANGIIVHNSFDIGVIAEELVLRNPNVACVVIDPVGIFWSMKYPNKEEKEIKELGEWGLEPKGIESTRVFVPAGMEGKVPKQTYDHLFSLRPAELNAGDWCLTFGIERFSPTGLLLEKAIKTARDRFKNNFSIDELIMIIEKDPELSSKEKGYKTDSRRALMSRFEAAKNWGILSKEGTSLAEICKEGHVSVIDISFLEENVASLVIGMLSRKILNARKMTTRQAAVSKYVGEMEDIDDVLNADIPPTWLFIDEAHTLIPAGSRKTAATDGLIEYVKQGRRPGCSLVFATQQPSAIDTRVLSQLDLLLCHKLVFDDDLKAVMHRMPTTVPEEYEKGKFIKTLPIGVALAGDRSDETSRAFCLQIRPRFSQHEGRETKSIDANEKISPEKLQELVEGLIYKKIEALGRLSLAKVEELCDTMSSRYKIDIDSQAVIDSLLKEKHCQMKSGELFIPGFEEHVMLEQELGRIPLAAKQSVTGMQAKDTAESLRRKKKLGLFGKEEKLESLEPVYSKVYKVSLELKSGSSSIPKTLYIRPDYEMLYKSKGGLKWTAGIEQLTGLSAKRVEVLNCLKETDSREKIAKMCGLTQQAAGKYLADLAKENLAVKDDDGDYSAAPELDIPQSLEETKFDAVLPTENAQKFPVEEDESDEKTVRKIPLLFGQAKIKSVETLLMPMWKAVYTDGEKTRIERFSAI
ncbi:MAG: LAGLIDADG family homing endonuclease [Candidatus Micrarchaeota archaeon]